MSSVVLLLIGLGTFFLAWRTQDEINRIAGMVAGTISLVWGFALTPVSFQLVFEIIKHSRTIARYRISSCKLI